MKKSLVAAICVALVSTACVQAQEEQTQTSLKWFDMENCKICKNMSNEKGLMENVKWEAYLIDNGMMSIAVVPENMRVSMDKAQVAMKATAKKLESGESINLCGFCQSYGELLMAGAKMKEMKTIGGDVMLITSDNPEIVEKIHAHTKKTIAASKEMKKAMAMKYGSDHKQHGDHKTGQKDD